MAKYTHSIIMTNFTEMLEEMPFDKITVSDLVRRCNISPNTFYYHYKNINELLNEWFTEGLQVFLGKSEITPENWRPFVKGILKLCKSNERVTYHIYTSLPSISLDSFAFASTSDMLHIGLRNLVRRENASIPEDKFTILENTCKCMIIGFLLKFVWNRMQDDIDSYVDTFCDMAEDFLSVEIEKYSR